MSQFKVWFALFLLIGGSVAHAQTAQPLPPAPPLPGVEAPPAALPAPTADAAGAPANAQNPSLAKEDQELLYRIATGRAEDIKILLDRGANPKATNSAGQSVLAIAAEREPEVGYPMAYYLIEAGADFKQKQPEGASPFGDYVLHIAILKQNYDLTWYLLTKGADFLNDRTKGKNAVELARETQNEKLIALLDKAVGILQARQTYDNSQEAMFKMLEQFAYYTCAQGYMRYYVTSGQDKEEVVKNARYSDAAFTERQNAINAFAGEIASRYEISRTDEARRLQEIAKASNDGIVAVLNSMIRNSNRKKQGVGTDADLEKRCKKVVADMNIRTRPAEGAPLKMPAPAARKR